MVKTFIGLGLLLLDFVAFFVNKSFLYKAYENKDKYKISLGKAFSFMIVLIGASILLLHYGFHFW